MKPLFLAVLLLCAPVWAQNPVTVRVVDAAGAPVPGAQVEARYWNEQKMVEAFATTGASGAATLDLPRKPDAKSGTRVTIYAPGFAFAAATLRGEQTDVRLERGTTWRGKVVDEAGKPIQGATIRLNGAQVGDGWASFINLYNARFADVFSAKSSADGGFSIADVPATGLNYSVAAKRFAAARGQDVAAKEETRIQLHAGGAFHGRLLGIDGQPLPKIRVFAQGTENREGYGEAQTGEDGSFELESLAAGNYNVMVDQPDDAPYLVAALENVRAEAGKTLELPVLRAVEGVVVSGIVREAKTLQPLAGAGIGLMGPHRPESSAAVTSSNTTGADGRFSLRALPGRNQFYFYQTPAGYLAPDQGRQILEIGAQAPAELVFEIEKTPRITGTTRDERGRPIAAQLRLQGRTTIQSDQNGQWSWEATSEGPFDVGGGEDEEGYFEVTSKSRIELPAPNPIAVTLRKKPWQSLSGRVVSSDGKPLEGVPVKASFFFDVGDDGGLGETVRNATTDAQGRFVLPKIRGGEKKGEVARDLQVSAQVAGFAFESGGEISPRGDGWIASDLIFAPLNRTVAGVTAPDALVAARGREMRADAQGKFRFENLPQGKTIVFAARDGQFGQIEVGDAPLQIQLKAQTLQPTDREMARDIWSEVARDAAGQDFYAIEWVNAKLSELAGETEDFEQVRREAREPGTPARDYRLWAQMKKWAPKLEAPQRIASLEEIARGIGASELRLSAWLDAALATDDAELTRRALAEAQTALAQRAGEASWREWNLYRLAVVTERIEGEKAAFAALDRAIALTLASHPAKAFRDKGQLTESSRDESLKLAAKLVAAGSEALLRRLLRAIDPETGYNVQALADAIPVVARTRGVEAALPLLDELLQMPAPQLKGSYPMNNVPNWAFGVAARRIIPPLGAQSPQKALELARRVTEKSHRARALASAAAFQSGAEAATLWREAVTGAGVSDAPRFALAAWRSDAKLGEELFEMARQKAGEASNATWTQREPWAPFAFYFAPVDAAQSRLILEREWGRVTQKKAQGQSLQGFARAMSAIDGRRAVEMARQMPAEDKNFWSLEARRKIAQYVAATEEQRRDWPFDRWGATDTWSPGNEEW